MKTERLASDGMGVRRATELLRAGGVVAFPTETVYGLGADATSDSAVAKVFAAKGRPSNNPLNEHVADIGRAQSLVTEWTDRADRLARAFWPGPLTIILKAAPGLSPLALAGGDTVGLRAPNHPVALELLRACGLTLAAPSANRSGSLSPVQAGHVLADLEGRIAGVLDGGACRVGIESTVVDLTGEEPRILRPGMVGAKDVTRVAGCEVMSFAGSSPPGEAMKSPGLLERHYAPAIPLRVVAEFAEDSAGIARIELPNDPGEAARALYALLWSAQASGAEEIQVLAPPDSPEWAGIRDRLRRASAE